jgi:hypothetical protein
MLAYSRHSKSKLRHDWTPSESHLLYSVALCGAPQNLTDDLIEDDTKPVCKTCAKFMREMSATAP